MRIQRELNKLGFRLEETNGDLFLKDLDEKKQVDYDIPFIVGEDLAYSLSFYRNPKDDYSKKILKALEVFDKYIKNIKAFENFEEKPSVIKVFEYKPGTSIFIRHNSIYIRTEEGKLLFLPLYISQDRIDEYLYNNNHSNIIFNKVKEFII